MQERSEPVLLQRAFVGREPELVELRQGLADAVAGAGRLFLISGEPGIGKTRLAEELSTEAQARGARVIWGRCWAGDGAPAYWPWIQVVRCCLGDADSTGIDNLLKSEAPQAVDLLPETNKPRRSFTVAPRLHAVSSSDPEEARFRLFDSVARLLKSIADAQPVMIILDDLQEADQASLLMLRFVARQLKEARVLIIGVYREAEVRNSPALSRLIGEIAHEGHQLLLRGLSDTELASWLQVCGGLNAGPGLITALIRATGGNPLFIDGILRTLAAEGWGLNAGQLCIRDLRLPDGVRESIRRRLGFLSKEANELLSIAAVIGQEFEFECLRKISAASAHAVVEALNEARRDGLINAVIAGGLSYRFAHDLIRETIYDGLSPAAQASLHLKVGHALEAIHPSDLTPRLAELARHYCESVVIGDPAKAIDYSIRAGETALAISAYEQSATHWRIALQLMEQYGSDSGSRADLYRRLGWMLYKAVDRSEGVTHLQAALVLYQSNGSRPEAAMVHSQLGLAKGRFSSAGAHINIPEAMAHFREAELLIDQNDLPSLAKLYQSLTVVASDTYQIEAALNASEKAMQIFERLGNSALWSSTASHRARALMVRGRHAEATTLLSRVAEIVITIPNPEIYRDALWSAAYYHLAMRNPLQAKRLFESGTNRTALSPLQNSMRTEVVLALEYLTGNLAKAQELSLNNPGNPIFRSQVAFRKGDWELAFKQLQDAVEWFRWNQEPWNLCSSLCLLLDLLVVAEEYQAAASLMPEVLASHQRSDLYWEIYSRPSMALLAVNAGRTHEAHEHLACCRKILAQGEDWLGLDGPVARAEGWVAAVDGRIEDAHRQFERATEISNRYMLPWDSADTLHCWGRALLNINDKAGALEKFDAAIDIYRRHSAGQRWIDTVKDDRRRAIDTATHARFAPVAEEEKCLFRHEGDYWLISFDGISSRLKHAKGMVYLRYLLQHPSVEVRAVELVYAGEALTVSPTLTGSDDTGDRHPIRGNLGDAGVTLDSQAKTEYQRRLVELRGELDEATRFNDLARTEQLQAEIDFLTKELTAAFGKNGKNRKVASHTERARQTVYKRIQFSLAQIKRSNPALAAHLSATIQTGYNCVYLQQKPIPWTF